MRVACVPLCVAILYASALDAQEVRVIGFGAASVRHTSLGTAVSKATGVMGGGELSVRARAAGFMGRVVSGTLAGSGASSSGTVATAEARAQLGPRALAFEAGYALRGVGGPLGSTIYRYARAGATSIIDIGASGLSARLSGGVYLAGVGPGGATLTGREIVSALEYRIGRSPLALMLGYRAEVVVVTSGTTKRAEQVNGILFGGGFRFGH